MARTGRSHWRRFHLGRDLENVIEIGWCDQSVAVATHQNFSFLVHTEHFRALLSGVAVGLSSSEAIRQEALTRT